jgi:hypothetical protein
MGLLEALNIFLIWHAKLLPRFCSFNDCRRRQLVLEGVLDQIPKSRAIDGPKVNKNASHREVWLLDLDGYRFVVAGGYGDL